MSRSKYKDNEFHLLSNTLGRDGNAKLRTHMSNLKNRKGAHQPKKLRNRK